MASIVFRKTLNEIFVTQLSRNRTVGHCRKDLEGGAAWHHEKLFEVLERLLQKTMIWSKSKKLRHTDCHPEEPLVGLLSSFPEDQLNKSSK